MAEPRDHVEVELGESGDRKTAVLTDKPSGRAWSGEGDTHAEAATAATRKFLGDRRAREYVG